MFAVTNNPNHWSGVIPPKIWNQLCFDNGLSMCWDCTKHHITNLDNPPLPTIIPLLVYSTCLYSMHKIIYVTLPGESKYHYTCTKYSTHHPYQVINPCLQSYLCYRFHGCSLVSSSWDWYNCCFMSRLLIMVSLSSMECPRQQKQLTSLEPASQDRMRSTMYNKLMLGMWLLCLVYKIHSLKHLWNNIPYLLFIVYYILNLIQTSNNCVLIA